MSLLRALPARSASMVQVSCLHQSSKQCDGKGVGDVALPSPIRSGTHSSHKKGTGGRSSFSGNVITVFGATGFLGLPVLNRLAKDGSQMIIPYRCDGYWLKEHKVVGDLGQILFFPFQLKDEASIRKVVKYSNIVVNLIGSHTETNKYSYFETHEHGARRLARISREMGVERFIHFSALNASTEPEPVLIPGGSRFLRSKALGEIAVREEFPDATIIRPAVMYGEDDKFITAYINYFRKLPFIHRMFLHRGGEHTYKMPVFLSDVALGVQRIVHDPSTNGQTYEFVGPHCYQLSELIDYMAKRALMVAHYGKEVRRHSGYDPYTIAMTNLMELIERIKKKRMHFNWEYYETTECTNDVLTGAPTLKDLGLRTLTEFEHVGGNLANQMGFNLHRQEQLGEYKQAPLPIRSPPLMRHKDKRSSTVETQRKSFGSNAAVTL